MTHVQMYISISTKCTCFLMRDEKEERSKHVQVTLGPTLPKRRRSESGGSWEIQSVAAAKVAGPFAQNCIYMFLNER